MIRRPIRSRHEGQALVLAALAFVLLVAALGLGIDAVNGFGQRRLAANAADSAAMAATRALVIERNGGSGTAINDAVEAYLSASGSLPADISWQTFYVDRQALEGTLGPVTDGQAPPAGADGVRVVVEVTVPTYFMAAFGQETLSISARGTAVFGPLGTAVGQDLAPLALSLFALERLKDEGEVRIDLGGQLTSDPPQAYIDPLNPDLGYLPATIPGDVITTAEFAHVSFSNVAGTMPTGNHCQSSTPADSLTYWWCNGSPNMLRIGRELPNTSIQSNRLYNAIRWRERERNLVILPIYAPSQRMVNGTMETFRQLVNFVAVEIEGFGDDHDTGDARSQPYPNVLRVQWVEDYASSGSMVGEGSAIELTEVWAVNLVR